MTPEQRVKYEDMYRSLWVKQIIEDHKVNPLARGPSPYYKSGLLGREYGARGGRPTGPVPVGLKKPKVYKMSDKAKIANRLFKKGLSVKETADILGVDTQSIRNLKSRYGLPRDE